jgi:hypothetical protein
MQYLQVADNQEGCMVCRIKPLRITPKLLVSLRAVTLPVALYCALALTQTVKNLMWCQGTATAWRCCDCYWMYLPCVWWVSLSDCEWRPDTALGNVYVVLGVQGSQWIGWDPRVASRDRNRGSAVLVSLMPCCHVLILLLITYLLTYLPTYLLTYSLHTAQSFLRS